MMEEWKDGRMNPGNQEKCISGMMEWWNNGMTECFKTSYEFRVTG